MVEELLQNSPREGQWGEGPAVRGEGTTCRVVEVSEMGRFPTEQQKAPERDRSEGLFYFFESRELHPRHFRWLVGFSPELISSDLSKAAAGEGCSPVPPPAAGISRSLLPGRAALPVLQKLLLEGQTCLVHTTGKQLPAGGLVS